MRLRTGGMVAAGLGLLLGWALWLAPAPVGAGLYAANVRLEAALAGLAARERVVDGVRWHYYVRHADRDGPCAVLVHGFTAEAANWFRLAMRLDRDRCLIVPDLPGFGGSGAPPQLSWRIPDQTSRLQAFLRAVRPQGTLDLVGSSMGGHIALRLALDDPQRVHSLTLMDAGGITSPQPSDQDRRLLAGERNGFDIRRPEEFAAFLELGMAKVPWMPPSVTKALAATFMARNGHYQAIFPQIYHQDLEDARVGGLKPPVLVLWGDRDRLLHVSMAEAFRQAVPGVRLVILSGIGHLPMLEAPGLSARELEAFWVVAGKPAAVGAARGPGALRGPAGMPD